MSARDLPRAKGIVSVVEIVIVMVGGASRCLWTFGKVPRVPAIKGGIFGKNSAARIYQRFHVEPWLLRDCPDGESNSDTSEGTIWRRCTM
jgi:hypothetical protein